MLRSELIRKIMADYPDLDRRMAEAAVNAFFGGITDAMEKGNRIEFRRFGVFLPKQRPARTGRNPRTGASVHVEARQVPAFRASKVLLKKINLGGSSS